MRKNCFPIEKVPSANCRHCVWTIPLHVRHYVLPSAQKCATCYSHVPLVKKDFNHLPIH